MQGETLGVPDYMKYLCSHEIAIKAAICAGFCPSLMIINILDLPVEKMSHERIYLCLAHMSGKEQDFIKEAFDQNWVVPMGPNVNGFEEDLEKFVNRREGAGPLQKSVCCL